MDGSGSSGDTWGAFNVCCVSVVFQYLALRPWQVLWINSNYQPSAILGSVNNNFQLIGYNNGVPR